MARTLKEIRICKNGARLGRYELESGVSVWCWCRNDESLNEAQIDALESALQNAGLKARAWKGSRIYINGYGRDVKAYIGLDQPESTDYSDDLLADTAINVWIDCPGQSAKWLQNRRKQVKLAILSTLHAVGILHSTPPADWRQVI